MAYDPFEWADGEEGETPITAERLNHMEEGIEDAASTATWGQVANRPSTFAPADHEHEIADVTGLQSALDNLQSQIDDLNNGVDE